MSSAQIIGRALQGLGTGVTMMGQQLREGRLQALAREERSHQAETDRAFRANEAATDRTFRSNEAATDRKFRADLQEDAQKHTSDALATKLAEDKPLNDARTSLVSAQAENERKGVGRAGSSAAVLSRDHLKKIYMGSSDGAKREGETDEAYQQRVNTWLISQETQKAEMPTSDLRLRVWKELKDTRVETERDGKSTRVDFGKLPIDEQLKRVDDLISRLKANDNLVKTGANQDGAPSPAGEGTIEDPYMATSQADIDWFKANAPKGAVITVNGKNYSK